MNTEGKWKKENASAHRTSRSKNDESNRKKEISSRPCRKKNRNDCGLWLAGGFCCCCTAASLRSYLICMSLKLHKRTFNLMYTTVLRCRGCIASHHKLSCTPALYWNQNVQHSEYSLAPSSISMAQEPQNAMKYNALETFIVRTYHVHCTYSFPTFRMHPNKTNANHQALNPVVCSLWNATRKSWYS